MVKDKSILVIGAELAERPATVRVKRSCIGLELDILVVLGKEVASSSFV
jgi:hypothetical protein